MGGYASGKRSWAISDRSGLRFPYTEMVREWNGMLVHTSEYEPKQPQLDPKPAGSDPQALWNPRPQPASKASLILLTTDPFTTVKYGGSKSKKVYILNTSMLISHKTTNSRIFQLPKLFQGIP